ncbi:MAG: glucose 1-dehydrogenase [Phycisphaera sp.]|nr:glucose 1-dehydrogenase [Phycisphaera sp.]
MTDPLFDVSNQVVLVSGGSRGIGHAIARGFAERGATVVITGRDADTLAPAINALNDAHPGDDRPCSGITCDVAVADDIAVAVAQVIADFDRIDTLINCAGVNIRKPVVDYTEKEYDFVVDINLKGAFLMAQHVGRHMTERGSGSIVNIDSLNSHAPVKRVVPYAISKNGMKGMTAAMAIEWGELGVRVNGLAPGFTLTDLTKKLWAQPVMQDWMSKNTPLRRLASVDDMIGTAIFLASPAAAFVTGQTIYVDGGVVAGIHWPIDETS